MVKVKQNKYTLYIDENKPGLLHGVTVGEKFGPAGVFNALGVTAFIPRSLSIDANPIFTENVEQEFRLDKHRNGVDGGLKYNKRKKKNK